jgi:translocation protein SEC63
MNKIIVHPTILEDIGHTVRKWRVQFQAPPQVATYSFHLHVMSDSYCGTDWVGQVNLDVQDVSKLDEKLAKNDIPEPDSKGLSFEEYC